MTSSKPSYLPKASPSYTIALWVRASTHDLQEGHKHSIHNRKFRRLKMWGFTAFFPFTSTHKTTSPGTPNNETLYNPFGGSIHERIPFWAFDKLRWVYQYAWDIASENRDFSFNIPFTCFGDNGHSPPEKTGLCILMKKNPRGWDSGFV